MLLTKNNHKTIKGEKFNYVTYVLYMSPFTNNSKGINLCPHASKGCSKACLFNSGFGGMYKRIQEARQNKTEYFLSDRKKFMLQLIGEIEMLVKKHSNTTFVPVFRLNGTSDIAYEKIKIGGKNIFEHFPSVQFYDYTKNPKRMRKELPSNYHLTFSRSEENDSTSMDMLAKGFNVAMVFRKELPKVFNGYEVINGDETDLRFLDKKNVIVGLTYKILTGKGAEHLNSYARESGFIIPYSSVVKKEKYAVK